MNCSITGIADLVQALDVDPLLYLGALYWIQDIEAKEMRAEENWEGIQILQAALYRLEEEFMQKYDALIHDYIGAIRGGQVHGL